MKINWFPGHMKKTLDMMRDEIKDIDAVIYTLDARAPYSSLNPSFVKIIKEKPIVFVLNKADLVDRDLLSFWIQELGSRPKTKVIVLNATVSTSKSKIVEALEEVLSGRINYYKEKGAKITMKAMIIGVPNSGKSTLANTLAGKVKAETGNRAGVTKSKQWIKVSPYIEVLDTPGALWPSLSNAIVAENLAFIGSVKDEVLDKEELCFALIKRLISLDSSGIENRYGINVESTDKPLEIIEKIANKKLFKVKGGELDYERTYLTILQDYKKGKITNKILDKNKRLWNF